MRPIEEGSDIPPRVPPAVLRAWAAKLRQLQLAHDRAVARAQAAAQRRAAAHQATGASQAELGQVNTQITATQDLVARKKAEVAALSAQVDEHRTARDAATARLLGTDRLTGTVATTHPLLLFPVRVETRFTARREAPGTDLLLRVYPDDIHLDSHEPALTEDEERRGKEFWAHVATAPSGTDRQEHIRQGWQRLTELFGSTRAAWIARQLDPSQAATVTRRDDSWTRAPTRRVFLIAGLPSVIAATGRVSPPGAQIPETVAVGPNPRSTDPLGGNGLPPVDAGMRWITEFDVAESIGMGLRIPVTEEDAQAGFDRIVVLGLKASWDAPHHSRAIGATVRCAPLHRWPCLVKQQVPTNNTADASAGYRSTDRNAADSMGIELGASLIQSDRMVTCWRRPWPVAVRLCPCGRSRRSGTTPRFTPCRRRCSRCATVHCCVNCSAQSGADAARSCHEVRSSPWPTPSSPYRQPALRPAAGGGTRPLDLDDRPGPRQRAGHLVEGPAIDTSRPDPQALQTTVESNPVVLLAQDANASRYTLREFPKSHPTTARAAAALTAAFRTLLLTRALSTTHDPMWDELTSLPESIRQTLLAEAMDVLTYRLDAWGTSLATRRLAALRQATPTGIRLGAYGWLEQVRRAARCKPVSTPPEGVTAPVSCSIHNKGFVHAPRSDMRQPQPSCGAATSEEVNRAAGASPFAVDLRPSGSIAPSGCSTACVTVNPDRAARIPIRTPPP